MKAVFYSENEWGRHRVAELEISKADPVYFLPIMEPVTVKYNEVGVLPLPINKMALFRLFSNFDDIARYILIEEK